LLSEESAVVALIVDIACLLVNKLRTSSVRGVRIRANKLNKSVEAAILVTISVSTRRATNMKAHWCTFLKGISAY